MTSSMVEIDTTILDALDFEHAPPCEYGMSAGRPRCDNEAEWKLIFMCCGGILLLCNMHKQRSVELLFPSKQRHVGAGGCYNCIDNVTYEKL